MFNEYLLNELERGQRTLARGPWLTKQGGQDAPQDKAGLSSGRSSSLSLDYPLCLDSFPSLLKRLEQLLFILLHAPLLQERDGLFTHYPGP